MKKRPTAAPPPCADPPTCRGRYRIREIIGGGPVGTVFLCWDRELDHEVALKVLRSSLFAGSAQRNRLHAACVQASRLSHPGLARVVAAHIDNAAPSYATPFFGGLNLRRLRAHRVQRERPFSLVEVVRMLRQLAGPFDLLHSVFPAHGLLKPENILVQPGLLWITDFHLAASLEPPVLSAVSGSVSGPSYQAPELAFQIPLSPAADVYSLAAIVTELLTGVVPKAGARPGITMLRPDLPVALEFVLGRALDDDALVRPSSVRSLVEALSTLVEEELRLRRSPRSPGASPSTAPTQQAQAQAPRPVAPSPVVGAVTRRTRRT